MWKSNVMVGQQLAAIWQTNFAKEEAAKAKIFNIFHIIRSYLFFSTFVGLHLKNQSYQEGKWEFQHVSQNRIMSRKDPRYKWNCLCISGLTKRWMWEVRARFVKIFQHFWWFYFYCPQSFSGGGLYSRGNGFLLLILILLLSLLPAHKYLPPSPSCSETHCPFSCTPPSALATGHSAGIRISVQHNRSAGSEGKQRPEGTISPYSRPLSYSPPSLSPVSP